MSIIAAILIIVLVIFIKVKMPMWKGKFSENLVYHKMLELPDEYTIFNDLLFQSNGRSTQIDHIVVSPYGVFVIETKGYKGWIMGGENAEYWTQVIYKSKHQFYNPIRQNEGHVRFLRHLLKSSVHIPIIPIVVFNDSADIKVNITNHIVVNRCDLTESILSYRTPLLNQVTIDWIVTTIYASCSMAEKEDLKQHKRHVRNQQRRSSQMIQQGICPKCGGRLISRQGKYGQFYGCSNYPSCKFTI